MNRFLKWALTIYGNLLKNPPHIPVFLTNLSVPVLENLLGICGMIRIHGAYEFRGRKRNGEVSRNHEFPKLSPASFEDSRTESVVTIVWSSLRYSTLLRFFDVFFCSSTYGCTIHHPTHSCTIDQALHSANPVPTQLAAASAAAQNAQATAVLLDFCGRQKSGGPLILRSLCGSRPCNKHWHWRCHGQVAIDGYMGLVGVFVAYGHH